MKLQFTIIKKNIRIAMMLDPVIKQKEKGAVEPHKRRARPISFWKIRNPKQHLANGCNLRRKLNLFFFCVIVAAYVSKNKAWSHETKITPTRQDKFGKTKGPQEGKGAAGKLLEKRP